MAVLTGGAFNHARCSMPADTPEDAFLWWNTGWYGTWHTAEFRPASYNATK